MVKTQPDSVKCSTHNGGMNACLPPPPPAEIPAESAADAPRDLRQIVLATARALLDEQGVTGLSMREVARRAGVTHQAPYHHFGDRESILAAVLVQGFDELATRMQTALARSAAGGGRAMMLAAANAYVGFSLANPGVFGVMFRREICNPIRFPEVRHAGARAHHELERLVHAIHGPTADAALTSIYWAHAHGLACLMIDGPLSLQMTDEAQRDAHLQAVGNQFAKAMLSLVQ